MILLFRKPRRELSVRPLAAPSYFLLLAQEKVTKEKGTPRACPPGLLPCGFASRRRGFSTAHPCADEKHARVLRASLRADPSPSRRARGAPLSGHPDRWPAPVCRLAWCWAESWRLPTARAPVRRSVSIERGSAGPSAARMAAQWGPYGAAAGGWNRPQGGAHGCAPVRRQRRMRCRRAPPDRREPAGQDARRALHRGAFSLGHRSLGKQRKVTRAA